MAVSSSAVEIRIQVTDVNSGKVIQDVTGNLDRLGNAGVGSGRKVREGMEGIGKGANESREQVRLLTEELGIRMPRAFQKIIAGSAVAQTALRALSTVMIGLGAIQIGAMIFTEAIAGIKKFYEKFIDVDGAMKRYNSEAAKAASENFYEHAGLNELNAGLTEANHQLAQLEAKKANFSGTGNFAASFLLGSGFDYYSVKDEKYRQGLQGETDKIAQDKRGKEHEENLQEIHDKAAIAEAGLIGIAKERRARQEAYDEAREKQRYAVEQQRAEAEITHRPQDKKPGEPGYIQPIPWPDANTGKAEADQAHLHADAEFQAQQIQAGRQATQELMQMRHQALEAGLQGEKLYHQQEADAIEDLKYKAINRAQAANLIRQKFHAEEMKRLEDEKRETEKLFGQAALVGFRGMGRSQAASDLAIADINSDKNLGQETKNDRVAAERMRLGNELAEQQRQFTEQIDSLAENSADKQVAGFARIRAEGEKQLADLQKKFDEVYGQVNRQAPGGEDLYQAGVAQLSRGRSAIDAGTNQQSDDLRRKNAQETDELEAQARAKYLNAEKQQTAAIETEYEQRFSKFQEELKQQEISEDDYNRRVQAAAQLRDAEMVEAARQAREKMAGEFSRFFQNPTGALKEMGDKAAGEMAASLMQRTQNRFGGKKISGMDNWTGNGFFDHIAGTSRGHEDRSTPKAAIVAGPQSLSVGTAQINVGSASIALGGAARTPAAALGTAGIPVSTSSPEAVFNAPVAGIVSSGGSGESASTAVARISSGSTAAPQIASGSTTSAVQRSMSIGQQGIGLTRQAASIFGGGKTAGSSGSFLSTQSSPATSDSGSIPLEQTKNFDVNQMAHSPSASGKGMLEGGGFSSNVAGAAGGATGLYSAYESNGGVGGTLSGAMSGMQLGMSLGGPIGGAIGAAGGAVLGAIGFGGKAKAEEYDKKTVQPRITETTQSYQTGQTNYLSAYSDLQGLDTEAHQTLKKMGGAGAGYYSHVQKEIKQAEGRLTGEERGGRSNYTGGAAQFNVGADSIPHTGMAVIHAGERIMPSDQNERITRAIESSADSSKLPVQSQSSWGGDLHIHAIDAKSGAQWLMANKHVLRSAINSSYADNSGGADA